jgi:hypothetical protein
MANIEKQGETHDQRITYTKAPAKWLSRHDHGGCIRLYILYCSGRKSR